MSDEQDLEPFMQSIDFWQTLEPPGTWDASRLARFDDLYPASLPDGRQIALPVRVRSGGEEALPSLILNQASFAVVDALSEALAARLRDYRPDVIVGMPTLGLTLAAETARKLGHDRYVPLGTSRKFWYDVALSVPLISITSPGQEKRLYIDPRMLPLLENRRFVLVDDVISTGASMASGYSLLEKCAGEPVVLAAAMLQTRRWEECLDSARTGLSQKVCSVFEVPRLVSDGAGQWMADA
ncbi:MAG: phosphoribosyltransferase [Rhizobiaceae bacterium MnEN-MB40S]|nr:MAG: phosphoribosyltransferase [Rhizobiaceae bacterium MnEN-MB40S]